MRLPGLLARLMPAVHTAVAPLETPLMTNRIAVVRSIAVPENTGAINRCPSPRNP